MNKDVVYSEMEISIAINTIENYISFLIESIDTYLGVIGTLQVDGIKDDLICSRISEIHDLVQPLRMILCSNGKDIGTKVKNELSEIESIDNFVFPDDNLATIRSILSHFI